MPIPDGQQPAHELLAQAQDGSCFDHETEPAVQTPDGQQAARGLQALDDSRSDHEIELVVQSPDERQAGRMRRLPFPATWTE
jgi:hypothetical protein